MRQQKIEILVGFIVLTIATSFFVFAYTKSGISKDSDVYTIYAEFDNIEGINEGSDIKIAGIDIGYVQKLELDKETFSAKVSININKDIEIPQDSSLSVSSSGLLGGRYLNLTPGGSMDNIKEYGKIRYTISAINLESIINKIVYSLTVKKE